MSMETDKPPKLDPPSSNYGEANIGVGGSRATKTGKPERVGESGDKPINLIFGEIQVLLSENRTSLATMHTGIADHSTPTPGANYLTPNIVAHSAS